MTNTNRIASATMFALVISFASIANAGAPAASGPMQLGASAPAPMAYLEFCSRQPRDCQVSRDMVLSQIDAAASLGDALRSAPASISRVPEPAAAVSLLKVADSDSTETPQATEPTKAPAGATLIMDGHTWSTINRANTKVNRDIIRKTDISNYGVVDRWSTPLEDGTKFGDCEDYVLEKRRALIAEGFPPSALSIAIVTTPWNTGHAVLLVASDKGEYVLDNLSPWIVPWNEAPYKFRKRQVAGDAFRWAAVQSGGVTSDAKQPLLIARAD